MNILTAQQVSELVIKKSRFIAEAFVVNSSVEARERLHAQKVKYADATHVCHAFIAGSHGETSGMGDDGEPSGTAGRPMLDVLKGSDITNILVTVTRYFGGTLLGTGGLVRAYADSVKTLLEQCTVEPLVEKVHFSFYAEYGLYDAIKHLFLNFHLENLAETYGTDVCVRGSIWKSECSVFKECIQNLTKGKTAVLVQD
ncbi:MAG: YigZ family protein [Treponema sp.]|nr:YigZ family protein [Treponema sp.]